MNEDRLRELLHADPSANEREAEERGWAVVKAAYAERTPGRQPRSQRSLILALAGAALLVALLLTPAGAQVREWIGDVVEGEDNAAPSLTSLPTSGELLVESDLGPWIVQPDGSKRLVGAYDTAAFSPRGRFLAVTDGRKLLAVVADSDATGQPVGTPRWEIPAAARVSDVAWAPSGLQVAYRAGDELQIVTGDGRDPHAIAESVAEVAPAWKPLGARAQTCPSPDGSYPCARNVLAYVDAGMRLHVVDADTGEGLLRHTIEPFPAPVTSLAWSPDGDRVLVLGSGFAVVLRPDGTFASKLLAGGEAARFSPTGDDIAVLSRETGRKGIRTEVSLIENAGRNGHVRRLYGAPGTLADLTWSPDGRWLLVGYPGADQWLFIPASGHGRVRPVAEIAEEFAPGARHPSAFPHISGWCCAP